MQKVELLKPVYNIWMPAAHFIGSVISGIILSVVFYVTFGISGIILRLLRKDLLDQKICINKESYWTRKDEGVFDKERYTKQF